MRHTLRGKNRIVVGALGSNITSCSKYEETEALKIFKSKNMGACREILFVCEKKGNL